MLLRSHESQELTKNLHEQLADRENKLQELEAQIKQLEGKLSISDEAITSKDNMLSKIIEEGQELRKQM